MHIFALQFNMCTGFIRSSAGIHKSASINIFAFPNLGRPQHHLALSQSYQKIAGRKVASQLALLHTALGKLQTLCCTAHNLVLSWSKVKQRAGQWLVVRLLPTDWDCGGGCKSQNPGGDVTQPLSNSSKFVLPLGRLQLKPKVAVLYLRTAKFPKLLVPDTKAT